jgi:hypothetical protein
VAGGHTVNLQDQAVMVGWPTPNTPSGGRSVSPEAMDATGRTLDGKKHTASLEHAVKFVGWPTPSATERSGQGPENSSLMQDARLTSWPTPKGTDADKGIRSSEGAVHLASWPTPVADDDNKTPEAHLAMKARMGGGRKEITSLQVMAKTSGSTPSGSPAGTGSRGQLNPAFSLWLMGYPRAWVQCGQKALLPLKRP